MMSKAAKPLAHHPAGSRMHGAGVLQPEQHDAYRRSSKWSEGTTCPDCHLQVHRGAWRVVSQAESESGSAPSTHHQRCPACERMRVNDPAAFITLQGAYSRVHREELRSLIFHEAQHQGREHPLERIMGFDVLQDQSVQITTTGVHLARAIGHALERAHKGRLVVKFLPGQTLMRVQWSRE